MIFIELEIKKNKAGFQNEISNEEVQKLFETVEMLHLFGNSDNKFIYTNYQNQDSTLMGILDDELEKVEDELFEKWNLESGIYVSDEDDRATFTIFDDFCELYNNAESIKEINDEEILNDYIEKITDYFNEKLDDYAKEYKIDKKTITKIKEDVPELIEECINNFADKYLNDKCRDKLEKLYEKWERAYKKEDYTKMDEIVDEIKSYYDKKTVVYRDIELGKKLENAIFTKDLMEFKLDKIGSKIINESERDELDDLLDERWE